MRRSVSALFQQIGVRNRVTTAALKSPWAIAATIALISMITGAAILHASGGAVQVLSTNQVSSQTGPYYRYEPSSAFSGNTWVHSWFEFPPGDPNGAQGYTSVSADGSNQWSVPLNQSTGGGPIQDLNLTSMPSAALC
jgi:hypothetical protein